MTLLTLPLGASRRNDTPRAAARRRAWTPSCRRSALQAVSTETFLRTDHLPALACISIRARESYRVKAAAAHGERGFSSQNGQARKSGRVNNGIGRAASKTHAIGRVGCPVLPDISRNAPATRGDKIVVAPNTPRATAGAATPRPLHSRHRAIAWPVIHHLAGRGSWQGAIVFLGRPTGPRREAPRRSALFWRPQPST
jgi:hypothetical protein